MLDKFITYIKLKSGLREIGTYIGLILFFGVVSHEQWTQHLSSDARELGAKDKEIERWQSLYNDCDQSKQVIANKYIESLEKSKKEDDSLRYDFHKFQKQIKK